MPPPLGPNDAAQLGPVPLGATDAAQDTPPAPGANDAPQGHGPGLCNCCGGPNAFCCIVTANGRVALSLEILFDDVTPNVGSATRVNWTELVVDEFLATGAGAILKGSFDACGKTFCYNVVVQVAAICGDVPDGSTAPGGQILSNNFRLVIFTDGGAGVLLPGGSAGFETDDCGFVSRTMPYAHSAAVPPDECGGPHCAEFGPFAVYDPTVPGEPNPITCDLGTFRVRVCFSPVSSEVILPGAADFPPNPYLYDYLFSMPVTGDETCFCPRGWLCVTPGGGDPYCLAQLSYNPSAYPTQAECMTACVVPVTYNCVGGENCIDPGTGLGFFTGPDALANCRSVCVTSWDCSGDPVWECVDHGGPGGTYATRGDCEAACVAGGGGGDTRPNCCGAGVTGPDQVIAIITSEGDCVCVDTGPVLPWAAGDNAYEASVTVFCGAAGAPVTVLAKLYCVPTVGGGDWVFELRCVGDLLALFTVTPSGGGTYSGSGAAFATSCVLCNVGDTIAVLITPVGDPATQPGLCQGGGGA